MFIRHCGAGLVRAEAISFTKEIASYLAMTIVHISIILSLAGDLKARGLRPLLISSGASVSLVPILLSFRMPPWQRQLPHAQILATETQIDTEKCSRFSPCLPCLRGDINLYCRSGTLRRGRCLFVIAGPGLCEPKQSHLRKRLLRTSQ